jgi:hypothetical protein
MFVKDADHMGALTGAVDGSSQPPEDGADEAHNQQGPGDLFAGLTLG